MKTRHKIPIIIIVAIVGFVIWTLIDMVCKPCIIPPDAPANYYCSSICKLEPRWVSWFRDFTNLFY